MAKRYKYKWLIIVIMLIAFAMADFAIDNLPLTRRNLSVGIALDMNGEEVEVTVHVVVPKQGGISAGGNSYVLYTESDKDIPSAMQKISLNTGKKVSVAHASSIVVGLDILQSARFDWINYFLKEELIGDMTLLVMTKGKAKDIIGAKVPVGEAASYQIGRVSDLKSLPLGKNPITAKAFLKNYYSGTGENWLPVVELQKNAPSNEQEKNDEESSDLIVFSGACILDKDGIDGFIDADAAEGLSLYGQKVSSGSINIKGREGEDVSIRLLQSKPSIKYDYNKKSVIINLYMKTIRSENAMGIDGLEHRMNDLEMTNFQNEIMRKIDTAYHIGLDNDYDIYRLRYNFAKRYPKKKDEIYKVDFLKSIQIQYKFKIIQR